MNTDSAEAVPAKEEKETPTGGENNTGTGETPATEPGPESMETDSITEPAVEKPKEAENESLNIKNEEDNEKSDPEKKVENSNEKDEAKTDEKKDEDKLDITKDPDLIARAQEEIKQLDIFVCGLCYDVFHFLEEFQEHKSNEEKCSKKPNLKNNLDYDDKPQIWGFTLWRSNQLKLHKPSEEDDEAKQNTKSWQMYQTWCKLEQEEKDKWINAGQTVQFVSRIGSARIHEFKVTKDGDNQEGSKKRIIRPLNKGDPPNKAYRTIQEYEKQEYVVEKIVGKRFNPRKKTYEYQIKWENFDSAANTWEPPTNLVHCKPMVDEFEDKIRKEKEKAKLLSSPSADAIGKTKGRGRGRPPKSNIESSPGVSAASTPKKPAAKLEFDSTGRPTRTSKQKALNQVKQWCGNISDNDEAGGVKRPFEDVDDSDDSFEKKIKLADYSDDSLPEEKSKSTPKPGVKPVVKQIVKPVSLNNGVGKKLPQNVLIPDANGVVRINQKQLPSLSTGVYIMSKTAGIIKLDSATSKVAASGGQTIVKVAPKIGQTQIRIVKKDGTTTTTTTTNQASKSSPQVKTVPKVYKPVITKVKKPEATPAKTPQVKKAPEIKKKVDQKETKPESKPAIAVANTSKTAINDKFDESDDGLEELEFPKDLPLPEPDSPQPSEFVLDPFTGKIAGKEYPEKEEKEDGASTLENIVKLAAADITEEDLKPDPIPVVVTKVVTSTTSTTPIKTRIVQTTKSSPNIGQTVQKSSILNKALTDSNIIQKPSPTIVQKPTKVMPRILNQSPRQQSPMIQRTGSNVVRRVTPAPRRFASPVTASRPGPNVIPASSVARNVYTKTVISPQSSGITKRPANVTTYSAVRKVSPQVQKTPPQKVQQIVQKVGQQQIVYKTIPPKSTPQHSPTKKKVINMPSLSDEPAAGAATAATAAAATTTATTTATAASPVKEATITADLSTFTMADADKPIYITGDDGTVYQVAGQNDQGETILITTGNDGVQQCLLVTNDGNDEQMTATPIEMPTIVSNFAATSPTTQQAAVSAATVQTTPTTAANTAQVAVTEPLQLKTDDANDQVVAQVVRAEPPSPGGTHKVIVMLPDGNLMVTQVSPEEYASLELE